MFKLKCDINELLKTVKLSRTYNLVQEMKNIRISVVDNICSVSSFDNVVNVIHKFKCNGEGSVCVDLGSLSETIKNIKSDKISLEEFESNKLRIKADKYNAKLNCFPSETFSCPLDTMKPDGIRISVDREMLLESMKKVITATEDNIARVSVSGLFFDGSGDKLLIVGTDGHIMAKKYVCDIKGNENFKFLFQYDTSNEIIKLLSVIDDKSVDIIVKTGNSVYIESESITVMSRTGIGKYIDFNVMLEQVNKEVKFEFDKNEIINAINYLSYYANQDGNRIVIDVNSSLSRIYTNDCHIGNASVDINSKATGKVKINTSYKSLKTLLMCCDNPIIYFGSKERDLIYIFGDNFEGVSVPML
jgi:DNA polymerase III sliding clamp (beta) subunit (PCNA family)